jgi:hypothetical protein
VSLVTGVVTGTVAGLIAAPLSGVAVGIGTMAVLLVPRARIVLGLLAIAGVVAAGIFVTVHQATFHLPANGAWPRSFGTASDLAWAGVVFLGADSVVEAVFRRRTATVADVPTPDLPDTVTVPEAELAAVSGEPGP